MMKCVYNVLKLGHNLVLQRISIKLSNWNNRWGCHTQIQDKLNKQILLIGLEREI